MRRRGRKENSGPGSDFRSASGKAAPPGLPPTLPGGRRVPATGSGGEVAPGRRERHERAAEDAAADVGLRAVLAAAAAGRGPPPGG